MKFAKQLAEYELAEWKGQYLPYQELKKLLYDIKEHYGDTVFQVQAPEQPESDARSWLGRRLAWYDGDSSTDSLAQKSSSSRDPPSPLRRSRSSQGALQLLSRSFGSSKDLLVEVSKSADMISPAAAWLKRLDKEALRVGARMRHGFCDLEAQFESLVKMVPREDASSHESDRYFEIRVIEALGQISEALLRLREFAEMNHAALYKILKKHDKVLGISSGLEQHLPRLVDKTGLANLDAVIELEARIQGQLSRMSSVQGLDASSKVSRIAAGLGAGTAESGQSTRSTALCFFLGAAGALSLSIIVLILLPHLQEMKLDPNTGEWQTLDTFSPAYFFSCFSVFRIVLCITLCLWGMGAVARVCTNTGINYIFLLGIDPRSRVTDRFLFCWAAFLTSFWILIFFIYIVDYKWILFPKFNSSEGAGYNPRASWHFVAYPAALSVVTLAMPLIPSYTCRCRFKIGILKCVGRTVLAPAFAVSLGDNIVGDVLSSLIKTFQDIPLAACYFGSHHPQTGNEIAKFNKYGNVCPAWVPFQLLPFIAALPFWFRMMQCAKRFHSTQDKKNLLNVGKYFTSILVVIVSRFSSSTYAVVTISIVAALYCIVWDVAVDWGLGFRELAFLACQANDERSNSCFLDEALSRQESPLNYAGGDAKCIGSLKKEKKNSKDKKEAQAASDHEDDMILPIKSTLTRITEASRECSPIVFFSAATPLDLERSIVPLMSRSSADTSDAIHLGSRSRRELQVAQTKRHFSARVYWVAVIFNILARCSWVFTLMPITTLSLDSVERSLFHTVIAAIEIVRRTVWVVLRMEHEQVANASGFRALLWVPRKFDEDSGNSSAGRLTSGNKPMAPIQSNLVTATEPLLLV